MNFSCKELKNFLWQNYLPFQDKQMRTIWVDFNKLCNDYGHGLAYLAWNPWFFVRGSLFLRRFYCYYDISSFFYISQLGHMTECEVSIAIVKYWNICRLSFRGRWSKPWLHHGVVWCGRGCQVFLWFAECILGVFRVCLYADCFFKSLPCFCVCLVVFESLPTIFLLILGKIGYMSNSGIKTLDKQLHARPKLIFA
jgi:hypothetical protein